MKNKSVVKMAGNILKAPTKSPFTKSINERCVPQPKHSMPKSFLFIQGNMYSSIATYFKERTSLQIIFSIKNGIAVKFIIFEIKKACLK
jgi:hypothetical protein